MPENFGLVPRQVSKYGWNPSIPDIRDIQFSLSKPIATPDFHDMTPKMPAVYNQLVLGSCTAQASGAAFEYDHAKTEPAFGTPSRLMIYYLERLLEGSVSSDSGAQIRDAMKVLAKYGVCRELLWPYDISKFAVKPPHQSFKEAILHKALKYARVGQTQKEFESVLASDYPIIGGFVVYESFETEAVARTGIVPMPVPGERMMGGHAILVVGYDRPNRQFIVRNSWGAEWGQKGYFRVPYEYFLNPQLAGDFWVLYTVS